MTCGAGKLPEWDGLDIGALLALEPQSESGRWRSRMGDANRNGRSYGGQTLGQAMMAACMDMPLGRQASMLQFLFLHGSMPGEAIEFDVRTLQEGKRFTSRHIRGAQAGGRLVLDAQATFALELEAPEHEDACDSRLHTEDPESLPTLEDAPASWVDGIDRLGSYEKVSKACMDFRIPDIAQQIGPADAQASLRFWMRARHPLPADAGVNAAAFAYLSDWWLNFSSLVAHIRTMPPGRQLYLSSLNHNIWFHRPFSPNDWMHFDCHSPVAAAGRGLSRARVHDRAGRHVASLTQECLMAYA